jgi:hypothetical protein
MKKKNFTMLELIAVISIMAVLLSITTAIKPNKMESELKTIGALIQLYQAKSLNLKEGEFYNIYIGEKFTITDETGIIRESKPITTAIRFLDGPTSKEFSFNHVGEVEDKVKVLRFNFGGHKVRISNFTGKFLYHDEDADYSAGNSNSL